ncbi:MAG TPA: ribosome biogenesis GTPase Der [Bacteroidia bacterium]|jgi:GTP-binding protein|nr:ribosome biogenesis GTPase Der [Bacteroidia bacterium]
MSDLIAIIGRPNVGKSTLFNRLVGHRQAIVDSVSGVTRDRHYGRCEWNGREFAVVDTGGYIDGSDDIFEAEIKRQVKIAIEEATMLLFVVDANEGITPLDEEVADMIRRSKKKIYLVANKIDTGDKTLNAAEFYQMGLGDPWPVSASNGNGSGELLDDIVKNLNPEEEKRDENLPRIAIVGRPNAGKSSIVNALLGIEKHIVTEIAGTTRDSIDTRFSAFGFDVVLVDTAGLRKKSKVSEDLEFYSVMRTIKAIEDCDIILLVVDAKEGFDAQDMNIFHLAINNKKGVVILVNKWDLVEKTHKTTKEFEEKIIEKIRPFKDVPIIFTSATTKQRVLKGIEVAMKVFENRKKRIQTSKLNDTMLPIIERTPHPAVKSTYVKIKYCTQLPTKTPVFAFFVNHPELVTESYKRFLENQLREQFNFNGVPMSIVMRKK